MRPSEILPRTQSIFIRDEDRSDTRSIYNILWSCLSTIFACTWITVHPNIPAPGDSQWAVIRRRLAIMGYFLLTPECVILWAARQHYGARYLTKKYEKNHMGWTRTHAFFLIMGEFTLHEGGKPVRIMEARELEELWEAGKIKWPTVTKEEIEDRSKGDYLSKTIVLFQTTWFVGQCIARGAYGLTVTELEVVTVAFASLTGVVYYLWWDKPLDVRCSIPVDLLDGRLGEIAREIEKKKLAHKILPLQKSLPKKLLRETKTWSSTPTHFQQPQFKLIHPPLIQPPPEYSDLGISDEERGTLFRLGYAFIGFPLKRFFHALYDMSECKTLGNKSLRVPRFYSSYNDDDPNDGKPTAPAVCVATVFGAIHRIAWSFHFATLQERWVWRISAILISGLPIFFLLFTIPFPVFDMEENNTIWSKLGNTCFGLLVMLITLLYLIARIVLLVLPFMALRALAPDAYVQLDCVSFLPHI
ncbi:hypothetical protein B0H34DRAFT_667921 [Crassisporium funariophilum]|nr:hypothetical protein B0H34DRAFT_667921 [Crassisporium funariophilum]